MSHQPKHVPQSGPVSRNLHRPFGGINSKVSCKLYVSIANAHTDGKDLWQFKNLWWNRFSAFWLRSSVKICEGICSSLHPYQQWREVSYSCPHQSWVLPIFFILAILLGGWWHLIVFLISTLLVTKGYQTPFMCWISTWIYFFGKNLFKSLVHF